jgi:hypothetical protein
MENDSKITNIIITILLIFIALGVWWLLNRSPEIVQPVESDGTKITKEKIIKKTKIKKPITVKPKDSRVGQDNNARDRNTKDRDAGAEAGTITKTTPGDTTTIDSSKNGKLDSSTITGNGLPVDKIEPDDKPPMKEDPKSARTKPSDPVLP